MESCESLEEDLTEPDPLMLEFPDLKEKLALKLTKEIDQIMTKLCENQSKFEQICRKLDSDYFDLEHAYFEHCTLPGGLKFVSSASATKPSLTFILNALKEIVDSANVEANQQLIVFENLSRDNPGVLAEKNILPVKRSFITQTKNLSFYVQYFLKEN